MGEWGKGLQFAGRDVPRKEAPNVRYSTKMEDYDSAITLCIIFCVAEKRLTEGKEYVILSPGV